MGTHHEDDRVEGGSDAPERVLLFRLDGDDFGIRIAEIGGVASCGAIREVPGAPACVLGLTEWRGTVLTVLDLPRLLDRQPPVAPACLIRLASPMEQTAFHLPATVHLVERSLRDGDAPEGSAVDSGSPAPADRLRLVRPVELVRRLELEIRRGN